MSATFRTKRNDTKPITAILEDADGNPVDLSGASVKFLMRDSSDTVVVDSSATIVSASAGKVRYNFNASDTDTAGDYEAEFEVTDSSSDVVTYPSDDYIIVIITEDVA